MLDIQTDPVLGFIDDEAIKASVFRHVRQLPNAFLIEGDFHNLQATNDALHAGITNQIMKIVSGIYLQELEATKAAQILPFRKGGGDEISFLVHGTDDGAIQNAIESAAQKVERFIEQAGLSTLRHHKYPTMAGSGLFVASSKINESTDYVDLSKSLHHQIAQFKQEQKPPSEYSEARDFRTQGREQQALAAIEDPHWQAYSDKKQLSLGKASYSFDHASVVQGTSIIQPRSARFSGFKNIPIEEADHTLVRFDLYNLGGLNRYLQQEGADSVRFNILNIVEEETVRAFGDDTMMYHVTGGTVEAVIPTQDADVIADMKMQIRTRLFDEVLSRPVSEFAELDEIVDISADLRVADTPYKSGDGTGVGIVMADMPIDDNKYPAAFFEKMDSIAEIHKIHMASFITVAPYGNLTVNAIAEDTSKIIDNAERGSVHDFPFSNSLKSELNNNQVANLFMAPVGVIAQQVFGLDIAEVLERQLAIKHLVAQGVDVNEILENIGSMEEFDEWVDIIMPDHDFPTIVLLGRPNTHNHLPNQLMTMSLSSKWGVVPEGLETAIVTGQLAHRTLSEFARDGLGDTPEQSLAFIEKDIRFGFANEPNENVRLIQLAHETTRALNHFENYNGSGSRGNDQTRAAIATVIVQVSEGLSEHLIDIEEADIANAFKELRSDPHLSQHTTLSNPLRVINKALTDVRGSIARDTSLGAEQKEGILRNFDGLKEIAESFSDLQMPTQTARPASSPKNEP